MDEKPGGPCEEARESNPSEVRHGSSPSDGGQTPAIDVLKWLKGRMPAGAPNIARHVPSLLDGDRADAGKVLAVLVGQDREVANHKRFGVAGDGQIGFNEDSSGAVEFDAQSSTEGRGFDTRGPKCAPCHDGFRAGRSLIRNPLWRGLGQRYSMRIQRQNPITSVGEA